MTGGFCPGPYAVESATDITEFAGRSARIVVGTGKQYDNAGNVMSDDFPEITELRLDP